MARPFLAKLVAGCVCMTVAGCNAMSRPDRHPIDGLRLIDNDEVSAAESSGDIGELKRLDLRI